METQTPKRKITTVTFPQQLVIHEIIGRHWKVTTPAKNGEPAIGHYLDGHTDNTIAEVAAKQLGVPVSENNVMGVRSQSYGMLFRRAKQPDRKDDRAELDATIAEHLRTVEELKKRNGELEHRLNGMVAHVNDARVAIFVMREMMQRNGVWSANTADLYRMKALNELGIKAGAQGSLLAKAG